MESLVNIKLNRILIGAFGFLAALAVSQTAGMAQTVTLTLLNPPNNGASTAGIDLSPYNFSVTPLPSPPGVTYSTALICDDFNDEIYVNESWTANVYTGTAIPGDVSTGSPGGDSDGALGSGLSSATLMTDYEELGYLAYSLGQAGSDQAALSFAIWSVFEGSAVTASGALNDLSSMELTDYNNALFIANEIATLPANSTLASDYLSNLIVYQPVTVPASQSTGGTPQQFLGLQSTSIPNLPPVMAEALSPVILGFDLLALFIALFIVRRRGMSNATANR